MRKQLKLHLRQHRTRSLLLRRKRKRLHRPMLLPWYSLLNQSNLRSKHPPNRLRQLRLRRSLLRHPRHKQISQPIPPQVPSASAEAPASASFDNKQYPALAGLASVVDNGKATLNPPSPPVNSPSASNPSPLAPPRILEGTRTILQPKTSNKPLRLRKMLELECSLLNSKPPGFRFLTMPKLKRVTWEGTRSYLRWRRQAGQ